MTTAHDNRDQGKLFEILFVQMCQYSGLKVEQNHIKARRAWKGKLIALESNLDFTIANREGRVGFVDAKSFEGSSFAYSNITDGGRRTHQLQQADENNQWNIPSGFVIFFRGCGKVCFYSGGYIEDRGPGQRFNWVEGIYLGTWDKFNPNLILEEPPFIRVTLSTPSRQA